MSFSARERSLMREHMDKDSDGTIDYKEFLVRTEWV
jgi:Ca2+-binding EF-hand superfamily protein